MDAFHIVIALVVGYLLGSIPFGLILTRLAGLGDIRAVGSGNIGATNVLRTGRKGLAAATLLGDMLKGTAAVLLMRQFGGIDAGAGRGLRRRPRPCLPGLAQLQRRQRRRDLYRRADRGVVAGGAQLRRDLGRGRGADALFVARRPDRERGRRRCCCGFSSAATPRWCSPS